MIDRTCPKVKKAHNLVEKHYRAGYQIIIIGTNDWCDNTAIVIKDSTEAKTIEFPKIKLYIVVQTTYKQEAFDEIIDWMIVIGGKHSANTLELVDISSKFCSKTIHIENASKISLDDLDLLNSCNSVGIITGASTPYESATDLVSYLKEVINIESVEQSKN